MAETVMCVQRETLVQRGILDCMPFSRQHLSSVVRPDDVWFVPRAVAEGCDAYVQVVSYVVVLCGERVLSYRRTARASASSLRGQLSVGVGGHVSLVDVRMSNGVIDVAQTIARTASREVDEEVRGLVPTAVVPLGILYDEGSAINRLHIAAVELWEVSDLDIVVSDPSIADLDWLTPDDLTRKKREMESWSAIVVDSFSTRASM